MDSYTGKNNGFPFLDILGCLKNTHKNPKFGKWDKSQPGNSQPSSVIETSLTLPNLGFLWVFFKYPKISKNGNPLFFPVLRTLVSNVSSTFKSHFLLVTSKLPTQTFFKPRRVHPRRLSRAGRKGATKVFKHGRNSPSLHAWKDWKLSSRFFSWLTAPASPRVCWEWLTICVSSACGNLLLVTW